MHSWSEGVPCLQNNHSSAALGPHFPRKVETTSGQGWNSVNISVVSTPCACQERDRIGAQAGQSLWRDMQGLGGTPKFHLYLLAAV